jgi:Family of unknown function (DUF6325)
MPFGPMQLLVIGFGDTEPTGEIAAELQRLREHDVVRLVDLLVVAKDADGEVAAIETTDLSAGEAEQLGAIASALIGLGEGDEGPDPDDLRLGNEVWFVADAIPNGTTAAIAVIEHRWAIPLRDAIIHRGGIPLADAWIHPSDLVAMGVEAAV